MMESFRVLVADSSCADIYKIEGDGAALQKIESLVSPAAHRHERDLGSDAPGRVVSRTGGMRHAYQPRHTLKEIATEEFLRSVVKVISANTGRPRDAALILIAAPRILSRIKGLLPAASSSRIAAEIPRDLVKAPKLILTQRVRAAIAESRRGKMRLPEKSAAH